MVDPMLELLPNSSVYHLGMYEQNQTVVQYYNRLPKECNSDIAYVLDPLMFSSKTIESVVSMLKKVMVHLLFILSVTYETFYLPIQICKWGVAKIHVLVIVASITGLQIISKNHDDVSITVGEIDEELAENGQLLPGVGDISDRFYGASLGENIGEHLTHTSKRKRSS